MTKREFVGFSFYYEGQWHVAEVEWRGGLDLRFRIDERPIEVQDAWMGSIDKAKS